MDYEYDYARELGERLSYLSPAQRITLLKRLDFGVSRHIINNFADMTVTAIYYPGGRQREKIPHNFTYCFYKNEFTEDKVEFLYRLFRCPQSDLAKLFGEDAAWVLYPPAEKEQAA